MATQSFTATLIRPEGVGTWTYFTIPFDVGETYGAKGQVKVKGTVNGHPLQGSAMPHRDGTHYVVVKSAIRDAICVTAGDTVQVTLDRDDDPRSITLPEDAQTAFAADAEALAIWNSLPYSHQREYLEWIEGVKKPETRARRIVAAIERVRARQRLK